MVNCYSLEGGKQQLVKEELLLNKEYDVYPKFSSRLLACNCTI